MSSIEKLNILETCELIKKFIVKINKSYSMTDFEFLRNEENWSEFISYFGKNNIQIENIHLDLFKNELNELLNDLLKTDLIKIYEKEYEKYKKQIFFNPYTSQFFPFSINEKVAQNIIEYSYKYYLDRELTKIEFSLYYRPGENFISIGINLFVDIGDQIVKKHHFAKNVLKSLCLKNGKVLINKENISKIMNDMLTDISSKNITTEDLKIYLNNNAQKNCVSDLLLRSYNKKSELIKQSSGYNDSSIINTEKERILVDFDWAYISCLYDDITNTYQDIIYYTAQKNKSLYFTILLSDYPCFLYRLKSYKIVLKDKSLSLYHCDLKNDMKWITKKEQSILFIKDIFIAHNVRESILNTIEEDVENELNKKVNKKIIEERKNKIESDIYCFFKGLDIRITFSPFETMSLIDKCSSHFFVNLKYGEESLDKLIKEDFYNHEKDIDLCSFKEKSFIYSKLPFSYLKKNNIKRL